MKGSTKGMMWKLLIALFVTSLCLPTASAGAAKHKECLIDSDWAPCLVASGDEVNVIHRGAVTMPDGTRVITDPDPAFDRWIGIKVRIGKNLTQALIDYLEDNYDNPRGVAEFKRGFEASGLGTLLRTHDPVLAERLPIGEYLRNLPVTEAMYSLKLTECGTCGPGDSKARICGGNSCVTGCPNPGGDCDTGGLFSRK